MATTSPTSFRTTRCLATIASLAAFAALAPCAARAASPDAVQFGVEVDLAAGNTGGSVSLPTVPTGKRLVIQTISYYRSAAASGTIGQVLLITTVNATDGIYTTAEVPADGALFPTTTTNVTIYADPGTAPTIQCYRTGSAAAEEYCEISVSGYYAAVK